MIDEEIGVHTKIGSKSRTDRSREGASIFETTGAWEDFATPSRDLRLLIAIDVVWGFPDAVTRRPNRFATPKDKGIDDVKGELQRMLGSERAQRISPAHAPTARNGR